MDIVTYQSRVIISTLTFTKTSSDSDWFDWYESKNGTGPVSGSSIVNNVMKTFDNNILEFSITVNEYIETQTDLIGTCMSLRMDLSLCQEHQLCK